MIRITGYTAEAADNVLNGTAFQQPSIDLDVVVRVLRLVPISYQPPSVEDPRRSEFGITVHPSPLPQSPGGPGYAPPIVQNDDDEPEAAPVFPDPTFRTPYPTDKVYVKTGTTTLSEYIPRAVLNLLEGLYGAVATAAPGGIIEVGAYIGLTDDDVAYEGVLPAGTPILQLPAGCVWDMQVATTQGAGIPGIAGAA